jgi:predicted nuclease of predicted toxin-antitoxin system
MILLADEGVDREIVARLRLDGHEVLYVAEMDPGISDDLVLERAREESAVLVTSDKDFGELVFRQLRAASGVILIRLAGLSAATKSALVSEAVSKYSSEIGGSFTVVSPGAVRIRSRRATEI